MNPLTQIKSRIKQRREEVLNRIPESASYHSQYRNSAYIYAGQLSFKLTEGDLLAIFSQYGEIVDVNLVRDKDTNESRGFAFIAYDDQRSTNLAVDNLNGAVIAGRTIAVDHVLDYKRLVEADQSLEAGLPPPPPLPKHHAEGEILAGAEAEAAEDEFGVSTAPEDATTAPAQRSDARAAAQPWLGGSLAEMLRNAEAIARADADERAAALPSRGGPGGASGGDSRSADRGAGLAGRSNAARDPPRNGAGGDEDEDPLALMRDRKRKHKSEKSEKPDKKDKKEKKEKKEKKSRKEKHDQQDEVRRPVEASPGPVSEAERRGGGAGGRRADESRDSDRARDGGRLDAYANGSRRSHHDTDNRSVRDRMHEPSRREERDRHDRYDRSLPRSSGKPGREYDRRSPVRR